VSHQPDSAQQNSDRIADWGPQGAHEARPPRPLTLALLWQGVTVGRTQGFPVSWFCEHYRAVGLASLDVVCVQEHRAGEKVVGLRRADGVR